MWPRAGALPALPCIMPTPEGQGGPAIRRRVQSAASEPAPAREGRGRFVWAALPCNTKGTRGRRSLQPGPFELKNDA